MKYTIEETIHEGGKRRIFGRSYIPPGIEETMPLVICGHRFGATADSWKPYAEQLVEQGYMVHAIDFGGACKESRSEGETWEMSVSTEVEDLHCVINSLMQDSRVDQHRISLMGASQGGVVAALTAAERPTDIHKLILLFPAFIIPYMAHSFFSQIEDIPERYDLWGVTLGRKYFAEAYHAEYYKQIGKFAGPVLLLHGDKDQAVPFVFSKRALKHYTQAQLEIIEDADHGFEGQHFSLVMNTIVKFLSNIC